MKAAEIDQSIQRAVWLAVLQCGSPVYPMSWQDHREWLSSHSWGEKKPNTKELTDYPMMEWDNNSYEHDSYWDLYGGRPEASEFLARRFIEDIPVGIDWKASKEPEDETESEFNSTDEPNTRIPTMRGVLVMNNGNRYPWIANFEIDMQHLRSLLAFIKEWEDKTDAEVLERIKVRIEKALNDPKHEFGMLMDHLGQSGDY